MLLLTTISLPSPPVESGLVDTIPPHHQIQPLGPGTCLMGQLGDLMNHHHPGLLANLTPTQTNSFSRPTSMVLEVVLVSGTMSIMSTPAVSSGRTPSSVRRIPRKLVGRMTVMNVSRMFLSRLYQHNSGGFLLSSQGFANVEDT